MPTPVITVRHADPRGEYWFEERCFITEWLNSPDDDAVSVARARIEPGVTTRWHRLEGITERYLIRNGRGRVEVGDQAPTEVTVGDTVTIPPGCRQRITNIGAEDLILLAVCTPRFVPAAYEALPD